MVTASDVLKLVTSLETLGGIQPGLFIARMKYGFRVDQDDRATSNVVEIAPGIGKEVEIKWDVAANNLKQLAALKDVIASARDKTLYRAFFMLGSLPDDVIKHCHPIDPPENDSHFAPDGWSLSVGPEMAGLLGGDDEKSIGWIGLKLGGNGYLYPLTEAQFIERAISHPTIQAAEALCRSIWPETARHKWAWHVSETG